MFRRPERSWSITRTSLLGIDQDYYKMSLLGTFKYVGFLCLLSTLEYGIDAGGGLNKPRTS